MNDQLVFPETLEKVINSYPFIRNCVLLTFDNKMVLVVHPYPNILEANRIPWGMFKSIMRKQITELNKELPELYKIYREPVITTSLIEQDRNGEVVRFPFNTVMKRFDD
jgi:long-subunit acyl-CoA synthetase (AMP-forming)